MQRSPRRSRSEREQVLPLWCPPIRLQWTIINAALSAAALQAGLPAESVLTFAWNSGSRASHIIYTALITTNSSSEWSDRPLMLIAQRGPGMREDSRTQGPQNRLGIGYAPRSVHDQGPGIG